MIRRPPRSTQSRSSAASDVYKRQGQEICPRPGGARREHGAGAAVAGLDLVHDEQGAVGTAQLGHASQVAGGRDAYSALTLDRLDDHGGDPGVQGALERAHVIVGDEPVAGHLRPELVAVPGLARRRDHADGAPVKAPVHRHPVSYTHLTLPTIYSV